MGTRRTGGFAGRGYVVVSFSANTLFLLYSIGTTLFIAFDRVDNAAGLLIFNSVDLAKMLGWKELLTIDVTGRAGVLFLNSTDCFTSFICIQVRNVFENNI